MNHIEEMCPHCDYINKVVYDGKMTTICKSCGQKILLCSLCDGENCGNCPYEKELNQ